MPRYRTTDMRHYRALAADMPHNLGQQGNWPALLLVGHTLPGVWVVVGTFGAVVRIRITVGAFDELAGIAGVFVVTVRKVSAVIRRQWGTHRPIIPGRPVLCRGMLLCQRFSFHRSER